MKPDTRSRKYLNETNFGLISVCFVGLNPIYQWVPPNLPQIISPLFRDHLVPGFSISDDPLTRHRALNIGNVTTDLSGLYSCRVSSNKGDSFKSKQLTVFCK